jgi:hypothetical protein
MDKFRELYRSSNGDVWHLVRTGTGGVFVNHQPNEASGGRPSSEEVAAFLATHPYGPQHQALLSLIGSLVEGESQAPESVTKE